MSKSLDVFVAEALIHVPTCPEPLIERAVRNACIDFCQRTNSWAITSDPESVTAADLPYVIAAPAGGEIFRVIAVMLDGAALTPASERELNSIVDWRTETGTPGQWLMADTETLMVYPIPSSSAQLSVSAVFMPTRTAKSVPDYLADTYLETILAGALSRLMLLPQRNWSDAKLGIAYEGKFSADCLNASAEFQSSLTGVTPRVRTRFC